LLGALAPLALAAACDSTPSRPPRNSALPPPAPGPSGAATEPAPMPSQAASDFAAARRGNLTPLPSGSNAIPSLNAGQRLNTDMTTAPLPSEPVRLPQR
jgi:hypothetical protein